jgi:hypothetical protein
VGRVVAVESYLCGNKIMLLIIEVLEKCPSLLCCILSRVSAILGSQKAITFYATGSETGLRDSDDQTLGLVVRSVSIKVGVALPYTIAFKRQQR